jgi:uncharacterized protein
MSARKHRAPLPQGPLVIDTQDLDRRAGSSHRISREVAAPDGLGAGLFAVPTGSPLQLDVLLESVVEGVYVTARVEGQAAGDCGYCLEPDAAPVVVEVNELYEYDDGRRANGPAPDPDDEAALPTLVEGLLDLEPAVRDAVVLAMPFSRLCDDNCPRLSQARAPLTDPDDVVDPRWAGLEAILDEASAPSGTDRDAAPGETR